MAWFVGIGFGVIYLVMLFTIAVYTYRKGHMALFIIGIFFPVLWLIGAILPAKPGSQYDVQMRDRYR